jgi:hypothetical protein
MNAGARASVGAGLGVVVGLLVLFLLSGGPVLAPTATPAKMVAMTTNHGGVNASAAPSGQISGTETSAAQTTTAPISTAAPQSNAAPRSVALNPANPFLGELGLLAILGVVAVCASLFVSKVAAKRVSPGGADSGE